MNFNVSVMDGTTKRSHLTPKFAILVYNFSD